MRLFVVVYIVVLTLEWYCVPVSLLFSLIVVYTLVVNLHKSYGVPVYQRVLWLPREKLTQVSYKPEADHCVLT